MVQSNVNLTNIPSPAVSDPFRARNEHTRAFAVAQEKRVRINQLCGYFAELVKNNDSVYGGQSAFIQSFAFIRFCNWFVQINAAKNRTTELVGRIKESIRFNQKMVEPPSPAFLSTTEFREAVNCHFEDIKTKALKLCDSLLVDGEDVITIGTAFTHLAWLILPTEFGGVSRSSIVLDELQRLQGKIIDAPKDENKILVWIYLVDSYQTSILFQVPLSQIDLQTAIDPRLSLLNSTELQNLLLQRLNENSEKKPSPPFQTQDIKRLAVCYAATTHSFGLAMNHCLAYMLTMHFVISLGGSEENHFQYLNPVVGFTRTNHPIKQRDIIKLRAEWDPMDASAQSKTVESNS